MRLFQLLSLIVALGCAGQVAAKEDWQGHYRLSEGPDAAGELVLIAGGQFQYNLAVGALDEHAAGRWEQTERGICLFTEPRPKPAQFARAPLVKASDGEIPTLLVTWPDGRGIAGVDVVVGFENDEPIEGYTQEYGWTMPSEDPRPPSWIELSVPMHSLKSERFLLVRRIMGSCT